MFRGRDHCFRGQSRIVLTKTELHGACKMDFCCITNWFLDFFRRKDKTTGGLNVGDVAPDFTIESTSDARVQF